MQPATNSFSIMPDLARKMPRITSRWLGWWRLRFALRALRRFLRVSWPATWLLGPQYRRSRDLIEIDITYLCNLHCLNCNRSATQAPDEMHMSPAMVSRFVDESMERSKRWRRVRVMGGEPTLHPEFRKIVEMLLRYQEWNPNCIVEVVTNGYGPRVARELELLPARVLVDNAVKTGRVQPYFVPFNLAPIDDARYWFSNFRNGCDVMEDCGMGLTPLGYYYCAAAGGIDRILGKSLGRNDLPDDRDDMLGVVERCCGLCGRFRDGHFVPRILRPGLRTKRISKTWRALYTQWKERRRIKISDARGAPGVVVKYRSVEEEHGQ